jgi:ketosteroid isomerase-like protein
LVTNRAAVKRHTAASDRSADLWTIRDGRIASLVGYPDRAGGLADIGQSE